MLVPVVNKTSEPIVINAYASVWLFPPVNKPGHWELVEKTKKELAEEVGPAISRWKASFSKDGPLTEAIVQVPEEMWKEMQTQGRFTIQGSQGLSLVKEEYKALQDEVENLRKTRESHDEVIRKQELEMIALQAKLKHAQEELEATAKLKAPK